MNTDLPISELVELLGREHASGDVHELLQELQGELEILITRHRLETLQDS